MRTRPLGYFEDLGRRYDRSHTLNFVTFARVSASLAPADVETALGRLTKMHPSLGRSIDGTRKALVPLRVSEGDGDAWRELCTEELRDGHWSPKIAPARAHLIRHPEGGTTLAITLWHAISDGKSGIFAMRDWLALITEPGVDPQPVEPTRLEVHLGPEFRRGALPAFARRQADSSKLGAPRVWRDGPLGAPASRTIHTDALELDAEHVAELRARALSEGITLHAVLSAALGRSILAQAGAPADAPLLSFHPVDMRAYLRRRGRAEISDSIGYHISFVDLALRLTPERAFWDDAGLFHRELHGAIEEGVPEFTATAGAAATRFLQRSLGVGLSRRLLEGPLAGAGFAISNLGPLERLGVDARRFEALGLLDFHFCGAASMTTNVCVSAVGLGGTIRLNVGVSHPSLPPEASGRLVEAMRTDLDAAVGA